MSRSISVRYATTQHQLIVESYPSKCGKCHRNVDPSFIGGAFVRGDNRSNNLEAVFQCTNNKCNSLIIGYYKRVNNNFKLIDYAPVIPEMEKFQEEIVEVSTNFVDIYNQALHAENIGLTLISGIGYRKALEFLVKDYLIFLNPDKEKDYLTQQLGPCINLIQNENIKEMARRASWIGNDEAHYVRRWADKDVEDLKKLIEVTVYYISMEVASKVYLEEMS